MKINIMNSKIYLIIGCIILVLVSVFVIILLLIKHPKPKYIPLNNNTTKKSIHKCINIYSHNEDIAKILCDNEDTCKGYYISSDSTLRPITFQQIPHDCNSNDCANDSSNARYTSYKTKVDNYTKPYTNNQGVCCKTKDLYFTTKGPDGEDKIQKMCDEFPACKGYYKHSTKPYYVGSSSEVIDGDQASDIDSCDDGSDYDDVENGEFPIFMKKNT